MAEIESGGGDRGGAWAVLRRGLCRGGTFVLALFPLVVSYALGHPQRAAGLVAGLLLLPLPAVCVESLAARRERRGWRWEVATYGALLLVATASVAAFMLQQEYVRALGGNLSVAAAAGTVLGIIGREGGGLAFGSAVFAFPLATVGWARAGGRSPLWAVAAVALAGGAVLYVVAGVRSDTPLRAWGDIVGFAFVCLAGAALLAIPVVAVVWALCATGDWFDREWAAAARRGDVPA